MMKLVLKNICNCKEMNIIVSGLYVLIHSGKKENKKKYISLHKPCPPS